MSITNLIRGAPWLSSCGLRGQLRIGATEKLYEVSFRLVRGADGQEISCEVRVLAEPGHEPSNFAQQADPLLVGRVVLECHGALNGSPINGDGVLWILGFH